jgi:hypothetical protein
MTGHRNVGGTRGWKARRGTCPVCKRDVATGFNYEHRHVGDPLTGTFRLIKRHGSPVCKGVGRLIATEKTREVK